MRLVPLIFFTTLALGDGHGPQSGTPSSGPRRHVHPPLPAFALRVLVPAYFDPGTGPWWSRLTSAASAHPGSIVAIGNPFDGPGVSFDPTYASAFQGFRAAGGTLIGYVASGYGNRPLSEVEADIDTWFNWYGMDGIFVDEMDSMPGAHESYYRQIHEHVLSRLAQALVVGNPGTSTAPSYLFLNGQPVVSALCIFEDDTNFPSWTADAWVASYPRRHFGALPYGIAPSDWQATVDHAYAQNCGFVYATDDDGANPWDTLPGYFEAMVAYIAATY